MTKQETSVDVYWWKNWQMTSQVHQPDIYQSISIALGSMYSLPDVFMPPHIPTNFFLHN